MSTNRRANNASPWKDGGSFRGKGGCLCAMWYLRAEHFSFRSVDSSYQLRRIVGGVASTQSQNRAMTSKEWTTPVFLCRAPPPERVTEQSQRTVDEQLYFIHVRDSFWVPITPSSIRYLHIFTHIFLHNNCNPNNTPIQTINNNANIKIWTL